MYVYILIYTHTHLGVNYVDEMKFGKMGELSVL